MKKVLFFNHVATLCGASLCLYQLVTSLRNNIHPIVVLLEDGPLADMFRSDGIIVYIDPRIKVLMWNTNSDSIWNPLRLTGLFSMKKSIKIAEYYCKKENPDIVHINTAVLLHLAKGAKNAGIKKVILQVRKQ